VERDNIMSAMRCISVSISGWIRKSHFKSDKRIGQRCLLGAFALLCVGLATAGMAQNAADHFEGYTVHLYNIDDEASLYINGQMMTTQYFNKMGEIRIPADGGDRDLELNVISESYNLRN
jgi:hypothetical protein